MSRVVKKSKRKPRRKFTPAFKEEICSLIRSGRKTVAEVCGEHKLFDSQVYLWMKKSEPASENQLDEKELQELRRLRKEVKEKNREVEFLKLASAYFAKESR